MYCPKCSQQIADNMRFCSRCRFPLDMVAKLISTGGVPSEPLLEDFKNEHSPRWYGMRLGTVLFFFGIMLCIMLSMLHDKTGLPEIYILLSLVIFVIGGLFRMAYAAVFEEKAKNKNKWKTPTALYETANDLYLQPEQSIPVSNYQTSDLNRREKVPIQLSVTEGTTTLLKDKHSDIP